LKTLDDRWTKHKATSSNGKPSFRKALLIGLEMTPVGYAKTGNFKFFRRRKVVAAKQNSKPKKFLSLDLFPIP
jgi:hypothetical protein